MRMPAQNNWESKAVEFFLDRVLSFDHWRSLRDVFQQIDHVASWTSVTCEYLIRQRLSLGQRPEPIDRSRAKIIYDISQRRVIFYSSRGRLIDVAILIPLYRYGIDRPQKLERVSRLERAVKNVPKIYKPLDCATLRVIENRLERPDVAVNV